MDDSADTEAWTMTVPKGKSEARIEVPRYNENRIMLLLQLYLQMVLRVNL